jgi:hypothetical protein
MIFRDVMKIEKNKITIATFINLSLHKNKMYFLLFFLLNSELEDIDLLRL